MAYTDLTYFTIDKQLPTDTVGELITSFIARYEPEILKKILGYDLYKAFTAGIAAGTPLQKWLDLRDGKEYQVNSIYYNWRGLVNSQKDSLLANYVWFKFSQEAWEYAASVGLKSINTENSVNVDRTYKQSRIYNNMVDMITELQNFIIWSNSEDNTTYPNFYPETINKINPFGI